MVQTHDVTLSDIITYRWRDYQRGDVIELRGNKFLVEQGFDEDLRYIMGIVGLPEETWGIKQGQVYINGKLLSADYLDSLPIKDYDQIKIEVPANQYLVILSLFKSKNLHVAIAFFLA
ncbi:MAG: S26 family signal peptidase [Cyanobacteria bacterium P01_G01_bin.39]